MGIVKLIALFHIFVNKSIIAISLSSRTQLVENLPVDARVADSNRARGKHLYAECYFTGSELPTYIIVLFSHMRRHKVEHFFLVSFRFIYLFKYLVGFGYFCGIF